ncbi:MAG: cation transporter [Succinivibrio sp.]
MKVRCDISGLDCPHCAAKLEKMLKESFIDANINFSMGTLVLEVEQELKEEEAVERAMKIATSFEDGISIELRD